MLNARGGIECDFTVTRLADDRFRIVTGTAFGQHDLSWIRQHAPDDGSVVVEDVTSRYACLGLWGPRARDLLQPLTTADLSNDAFRYMRAQEVDVGPVPCLALRVTYVGELGWELYCPMEFGLRLWDTLWEAGREHGLVAGGYKAIDSCRLEKGYRVWGADITPDDNPFEAGLDFAVKLDKGEFTGPRRAARRREAGAQARLPRARRPARGRARLRARADRRADSSAASPAAATATRSSARSPTRTSRPSTRSPVGRSRSRSSASGSRARSRPSRCTTRPGRASAPSRQVQLTRPRKS